METLLQDLRYAARSLAKSPVLTAAAVLTLGLGIGANSAMFGVIDQLFFRAPPYVVAPDRVGEIDVTLTMPPFGTFTNSIGTYPRFADFRDHTKAFSAVAARSSAIFSLGFGERAQRVRGEEVTGNFFSLLGVQAERGRFFSVDEDRPDHAAHVAVLSYEFWRRQFGAADVLGTTLQLGRSAYTVIGVAPAGFSGIGLEIPDVWVPMSAAGPEVQRPKVLSCEGCYWLRTIGRLAPGVTVAQAGAEGTALYRGHVGSGGRQSKIDSTAVVSFSSIHGAISRHGESTVPLAIWLGAMCGMVLLIACANVANLLLARAVQRRREIAVRVALGSSRGRLMRQLYAESLLLALLGGGAAILVTLWAGPALRAAILPDATAADAVDLRVLLFTSAVAFFTAFLAGLAPALHASSPDLSGALKSGAREGTFQRSFTRTGLLVGQVALTLVLLTGAGLFITSLRHAQGIRLGFDADRLIVASMDLGAVGFKRPEINAMYQRVRERVARVPGVTGASLSIGTPFQSSWAVGLEVPGLDSIPSVKTGGPYVVAITPDYFKTLGSALKRGRVFTDADGAGAQRVVIVNETFARLLWPGQEPLGKCMKIGEKNAPCSEVVGVVEDARRNTVKEEVVVQYYIPLAQSDSVFSDGVSSLIVRTAGPAEQMTGTIRREVQATSPDLPYPDIDPMPRLFADQMRPWRLGSTLFSLFGGLALLLAAIGLYGVLSYVVSQRTQELGVRVALGAGRRELLGLVVGQGLKTTLLGVGLGVLAALFAGKALASLLYGVSPHDPLVLITGALALLLIAAIASYFPALRATRVDPMVALRYE